ncbi:AI-2E family transporter [Deinococcus piscis]|uniref:AI-2E family transporter n=1 Tax=Deinococcus piscis TaxID=394230 RepID=A0ABQ3K8W7_9DEIO|nr:AI-2E family transporter [Deinococcus piscis]GHG08905.1 AI-2E family transporter [Deinococcus piscis]
MNPRHVRVINLLPAAFAVLAATLALNFFGQVTTSLLAVTLAVLLASALNPVARFFERWIPRSAAAILTVLLLLGGILGLGALALPPIVGQLSGLVDNLPGTVGEAQVQLEKLAQRYPQLAPLVQPERVGQFQAQLTEWLSASAGSLLDWAARAVGLIFTGVVTLVMVIFVLSNPAPLIGGVLGAFPPEHRMKATRTLAQILVQMGAWGRATLTIMLATGVIMATGLYFLGVENWLVFGVLSALGELIPNVGPILAGIPPVLFTAIDDPQKAIYVAVFAVVFQQLESYILAPFLLGGAGRMHPLSVTVGVLLFGSVFGIVGAFLTVPFLIVIKAVYEYFYLAGNTRPEVTDEVAQALIRGDVGEEMEREQEREDILREQREKAAKAEAEAKKAQTGNDKKLSMQEVEELLDSEVVGRGAESGAVPAVQVISSQPVAGQPEAGQLEIGQAGEPAASDEPDAQEPVQPRRF